MANLFDDPGAKYFVSSDYEGQHSPRPILNGADIAFVHYGATRAVEREGLGQG